MTSLEVTTSNSSKRAVTQSTRRQHLCLLPRHNVNAKSTTRNSLKKSQPSQPSQPVILAFPFPFKSKTRILMWMCQQLPRLKNPNSNLPNCPSFWIPSLHTLFLSHSSPSSSSSSNSFWKFRRWNPLKNKKKFEVKTQKIWGILRDL